MSEATPQPGGPQGLGPFGVADLLTLSRIPLAAAFWVVQDGPTRIGILVVAAVSDLADGWVARRWGGSRFGGFLDPVADKIFTGTAFLVVLLSGRLAWWEVGLVVLRDILATLAFIVSIFWKGPRAIPARLGGKVVTVLQLATLFAFLLDSRYLEPWAWAAAATGLYAIIDYAHAIPTGTRPVGG